MKEKTTKDPRGGSRPGAGRKPTSPSGETLTRCAIRLRTDQIAAIRDKAKRDKVTPGGAHRDFLDKGIENDKRNF